MAQNSWLSYWSEHREDHSQNWFLNIYVALGASNVVVLLLRNLIYALCGLLGAHRLHEKLLYRQASLAVTVYMSFQEHLVRKKNRLRVSVHPPSPPVGKRRLCGGDYKSWNHSTVVAVNKAVCTVDGSLRMSRRMEWPLMKSWAEIMG